MVILPLATAQLTVHQDIDMVHFVYVWHHVQHILSSTMVATVWNIALMVIMQIVMDIALLHALALLMARTVQQCAKVHVVRVLHMVHYV
jgi:hypothetical protein